MKHEATVINLCTLTAAIMLGVAMALPTSCKTPEWPPWSDTTTTTIPGVPPVTTTTIPPVVNDGDTDVSGYDRFGNYEFRNAKTVMKTLEAKCGAVGGDSGPFGIVTLESPTPWPTADGHCNAIVVCVWNGQGTYFDYVANGTVSHGWRLEHIIGGCAEAGRTPPQSGEKVGFFVMNYEGTERSSVAWTVWP